MTRSFAASTMLAVALLAGDADAVRAQTPASPPPATTAAPMPAPAADIVKTPEASRNPVHGSLTAGFQFLQGVTQAWGGSFDGNLSKAYSERGTFVTRGTYNYAKVTIADAPKVDKVQANRGQISVGLDQTFGAHGVVQARSLYLRDPVQQIFSRYEELVGVGYRDADKAKRIDFAVVPGVSLLRQDTFLATDLGWQAAVGLHQQLGVNFNKSWSVAQGFNYRHNLRDEADSIEESASLTGLIAKGLGLQIQHLYTRESLVPPGVPPYQQTFQVGLQVKF